VVVDEKERQRLKEAEWITERLGKLLRSSENQKNEEGAEKNKDEKFVKVLKGSGKENAAVRKESSGSGKKNSAERKEASGSGKKNAAERKEVSGSGKEDATERKEVTGARKKNTAVRKESSGSSKENTTERNEASGSSKENAVEIKIVAGCKKKYATERKEVPKSLGAAKNDSFEEIVLKESGEFDFLDDHIPPQIFWVELKKKSGK
jgi:hypothetical protein